MIRLSKKTEYRILVVSDTHGENRIISRILKKEPDIDMLIHCGDVCGDLEAAIEGGIPVCVVAGNCDSRGSYPEERVIKVGKYKIFITHGHRYAVDWRDDLICYAGKEKQADVVCFGHTHVPHNLPADGMLLLNPGSAARPRQTPRKATYAILTIKENELPAAELKLV